MEQSNIRKYGIYWVNLGDSNTKLQGEQGNTRPCICVSNEKCNKFSPTITLIPLSSKTHKLDKVPTHVLLIPSPTNGLTSESLILCEQVITLSRKRITGYIGEITNEILRLKIRKALDIQLGNLPIIAGVNKMIFTTRMSNEIRKVIIDIIKRIRALEVLISESDSEIFIKLALQERENKLNKLEYVCNKNGFNYCEFYERYEA